MDQSERVIANQDLMDVVTIAKQRGYRVYTFESTNKNIEQIFIEHTSGKIGSCSTYYGGIQFSTIHKPVRGSGNGTGFGGLIVRPNSFNYTSQEFNNPQDLDICFIIYPYWFTGYEKSPVEKYENFQEYADKNKILKYFEI